MIVIMGDCTTVPQVSMYSHAISCNTGMNTKALFTTSAMGLSYLVLNLFIMLEHITQLVAWRTHKHLSACVVKHETCAVVKYAIKKRVKLTNVKDHLITAHSMAKCSFIPLYIT